MNRSPAMDSFLESLYLAPPNRSEKMARGDCVGCPNKGVLNGMSPIQRREYSISGLCAVCQGVIFEPSTEKKRKIEKKDPAQKF